MEAALERLLDALEDPHAPTTVHDRAEAERVHIADSLAGVPLLRDARRIADLGSGAGLPGLVLAAVLPASTVVLVESARRKAQWLEATVERMALANVEVRWARAEELPRGGFDAVTARALAALPVLCEYAAPLLEPDGLLVCWKGAVGPAEAADGRAAAAALGLSEPEIHAVTPYDGSRNRTLWVFRRVGEVPPGYPRRPGMAAKRPITDRSAPNPPPAPIPSDPA